MKSENFWSGMAKNYDKHVLRKYRDAYRDTIEKSRAYLSAADTVLDVGCGSGIITVELADHVKEIVAVDTAEKMIEVAAGKTKNASIQNIRYAVTDIFDTRWENGAFDAVMVFNVLCYIKNLKPFLMRVDRLLKPGGVFLSATDCNGEHRTAAAGIRSILGRIGVIPYTANFSARRLERIIRNRGFVILESHSLYPEPPNQFIAARKPDGFSITS
jgi:ubiquinone/menaquinone biosynthesis C-methylase UbiE